MSNVPQARAELLHVADMAELAGVPFIADEIRLIVTNFLYREEYTRPRAPNKSPSMTERLDRLICSVAYDNPDMTLAEIGARFEVNPGRVSEALKRNS